MKTRVFSLTILALIIGVNIFARGTFQTFPEGFNVNYGCKLYVNKTFMQLAKQKGTKDVIAAYICAENEDDPETAVLYNINIYDESQTYNKVKSSGYAYFEKKYLDGYVNNLENNGIGFNFTTYQGVSALEYSFDQMVLPIKAIMFLKNKKSYLVQVGARYILTTKYNTFKTRFEILKDEL